MDLRNARWFLATVIHRAARLLHPAEFLLLVLLLVSCGRSRSVSVVTDPGEIYSLMKPAQDSFEGKFLGPFRFPDGKIDYPQVIKDKLPSNLLIFPIVCPSVGSPETAVFLVDFPSYPNSGRSAQYYRDRFFEDNHSPGGSLKDFFNKESYGRLTIAGDVVGNGFQRVSSDYIRYSDQPALVGELISKLDSTVDFSQFDTNGDGVIDSAIVVMSKIEGDRAVANGILNLPTADGVSVRIAAFLNENDSSNGEYVAEHEFGHLLGLADYYDLGGDANNPNPGKDGNESFGLGKWDPMALGIFLSSPASHCGWSKVNLGWAEFQDLLVDGEAVSVEPTETDPPQGETKKFRRIFRNGLSGSEYFVLDNRQGDQYPGKGLLVFHVDEEQFYEYGGFGVNDDEDHKFIDIEEADGWDDLDHRISQGDAGDPFPGNSSKTEFAKSPPANPNSYDYEGNPTGVNLTGITLNGSQIDLTAYFNQSEALSPELLSAKSIGENSIFLFFSEIVREQEASDPSNYQVSPSLPINGAQLEPYKKTVKLTTGKQAPNVTYAVTVSGINDSAGNPINPSKNSSSFIGWGPLSSLNLASRANGAEISASIPYSGYWIDNARDGDFTTFYSTKVRTLSKTITVDLKTPKLVSRVLARAYLGIDRDIYMQLYNVDLSIDGMQYNQVYSDFKTYSDADGTIDFTIQPARFIRLEATYTGGNEITGWDRIRDDYSLSEIEVYEEGSFPVLSALSKPYGYVDEKITLLGKRFGSGGPGSRVTFDGIDAQIVSWTDTSVTIRVPFVSSYDVPVAVIAEGKASNSLDFRIAPRLESISPNPAEPGAIITLTGDHLYDGVSQPIVELSGLLLPILTYAETEITLRLEKSALYGAVPVPLPYPEDGILQDDGSPSEPEGPELVSGGWNPDSGAVYVTLGSAIGNQLPLEIRKTR